MAYEVFKPCGGRSGIPRGMFTLSARGMARCNAKDLAEVGISDRATLLIDRERRSLALRAPIDGEQGQTVSAEDKSKTIWLKGAMCAIGLNPADFHGWRECYVKEDRLEIQWPKGRGKAG